MLKQLFFIFFRIGLFTFGGGYAMIANIREVVVEQKQWLDENELMEVVTIAESTPGPIAINLSTYVGYKKGKIPGSIAATAGVVFPSLIIIYLISLFLDAFMANPYVAYAFVGIQCAVAFLILKAGLDMFRKLEKKPVPMITFGVVFAFLFCMNLLSLHFSSIVLILLGGLLGIFLSGISRKKEGKA